MLVQIWQIVYKVEKCFDPWKDVNKTLNNKRQELVQTS